MTESTALLRQDIAELHARLSQQADHIRLINQRLQIDPGGSDRLDAIDDALLQLSVRVAALEAAIERLSR